VYLCGSGVQKSEHTLLHFVRAILKGEDVSVNFHGDNGILSAFQKPFKTSSKPQKVGNEFDKWAHVF
jgi:hypothetical protein